MLKKRIQSPSSINTYKQCPRRYYYQYIQNLPTLPNIHQLRGNIAHDVLESFYDINLPIEEEGYPAYFKTAIQKLLLYHWSLAKPQLEGLKLNPDQEKFYFEETMLMLMNWVNHFLEDLEEEILSGWQLPEAFEKLTPLREQKYVSEDYGMQGFIDAIHQIEEEVHLIDYKTNANLEMTEEQRLQLAIYSLLYYEKQGKLPAKAGIFFLRHKLKLIKVDEELLDWAKREIMLIHEKTQSEEMGDYPQKHSALCKWSSGRCDFYGVCGPKGKDNKKNMDKV